VRSKFDLDPMKRQLLAEMPLREPTRCPVASGPLPDSCVAVSTVL
jgi:hypothetical protein